MKKILTTLLLFVTSLTMAQTYEIQGLEINAIRYTLGDNIKPNRAIEGDFGDTNIVGVILKVTSLGITPGTQVTGIKVDTRTIDSQGNPATNTVRGAGPLVVGQSYVFYLPGNQNIVTTKKNQYFFDITTVLDFENSLCKTPVVAHETFKIRPRDNPLPVTLTSFTAARTAGVTHLAWTTATEVNNSHYEVESSANGNSFTTLRTVAGGGNTQGPRSYTFRDTRNLTGTVYYRLRQVDVDGTAAYSSVLFVGTNTAMRTYNVGSFAFSIPEGATPNLVAVIDMNGRVLTQQLPDAPLILPTEGTMFVLVLTTKEGKRYTKKVL